MPKEQVLGAGQFLPAAGHRGTGKGPQLHSSTDLAVNKQRELQRSPAERIIKHVAKWNAVPGTSWELAGGANMLSCCQKAQEEKQLGLAVGHLTILLL